MRGELGRTRLYTIRELRRRAAAAAIALIGAVGALTCAIAAVSWMAGGGWRWPSFTSRPLLPQGSAEIGTQAPFTVSVPPAPTGWVLVVAVCTWLVWLRVAVLPILGRRRGQDRHHALAQPAAIRAVLGDRRVRRAGRYTLPGLTWWQRFLAPTSQFGYPLGRSTHGDKRGPRLWADWEQRVRIIARTGWGKTYRLLIPIIRDLPGPALISSIEPDIFIHTVTARTRRRKHLRWRPLDRAARRWLPTHDHPVAVADFSAPEHRFAAGYPTVRWNPINGCEHFGTAARRATTMVSAMRTLTSHTAGRDEFFIASAIQVLAAWFHAAALAGKEIDDIIGWLRKPTDPTPRRILEDDHRAERVAELSLSKHLDERAAKTTSGVERYLMIAMSCLACTEGRALCGRRFSDDDGAVEQFDMTALIEQAGTLYILTEEGRTDFIRPLLSLFTAEMFRAARNVAMTHPGRRLPLSFIAVLDEPRHAVPVPELPHVANTLRKHNIGYIFAAQSSAQEDELYGPEATAVRAAAGVSLIGGIDISSAKEISDRAGTTSVVTGSRGAGRRGDQIQTQQVWTVGDQQTLVDGQATVMARGLPPFVATVEDPRTRRRWRRIVGEASLVARHVAAAGAAAQAEHDATVATPTAFRREKQS
ncbi:Putative traG-family protein [Alloactinosynnema sp. L-07]|uniref:type IV secretory system conjugative DNA transfer family protein n=1 Tax=Alloactinosynnema sp. L-07 TaxID=1653480 RepID=UPI00065F03EB|nr:TraM recognition domain-containing protein [Alloactinosynnema sp. L-07]CRK59271.1 Putative traG-family protein [Alloactinosynnema sp. L-07]